MFRCLPVVCFAGFLAAATPALGQPVFVPSYRAPVSPGVGGYTAPTDPGVGSYYAPTSPGIANYVAPYSPGVMNYMPPVGVPGRWVNPARLSPGTTTTAGSQVTVPTSQSMAFSPLLGTLFGRAPGAPVRGANDIHVVVPHPDAVVTLNGATMNGTGWSRHLAVDGVNHGQKNEYTLTATWKEDGKPMTETRVVHLDGSGHALADFR